MFRFPVCQNRELSDSIVPQVFIKRDGDILYFDKINLDEGRFCRIDSSKKVSAFEVGEGQGIITGEGDMYLMEAVEDTVLTKYYPSGKIQKSIKLRGIFFDLKTSASGDVICLGNQNGRTVIKIMNRKLEEIYSLEPTGLMFGSCIYVEGDEIYLGGFDSENRFKILHINYIGNLMEQWEIHADSSERIIGKITRYNDYFILLISGGRESIVLFNTTSGFIREFFPCDFKVEGFTDINIYGSRLSILCGRNIYDMEISDIINYRFKQKAMLPKINTELIVYMYAMYYGRLGKEIISCARASGFLTLLFYAASCFTQLSGGYNFGFRALIVLSVFCISDFTIASVKNIIAFSDKSARVEQLLCINECSDYDNLNAFPYYAGITGFCIMTLIMLPYLNLLYSVIVGILSWFVFSLGNKLVIKRIAKENHSIIIELLRDDDMNFRECIKSAVNCLKDKGTEILSIELTTDREIAPRIPLKWFNSRRGILKNDIKTYVDTNKIITVFDLSKRDIKYSRTGILMDYICFIKREAGVREIQIAVLDKDI